MHIALYDEEKNTGAHMLKQDQFVTPLLAWYDKNKREMVWRDRGNAYYTWISEIMLQQTRIEAAKDYFVTLHGGTSGYSEPCQCASGEAFKIVGRNLGIITVPKIYKKQQRY